MQFQVVPVVLSLGGAFLFAFNSVAQIQMDLDILFDGTNTPPANLATPWLTVTFTDQGANQVLFHLEATDNLTGIENVKQFYFNFDDTLDLGALAFTPLGASGDFKLPDWTFDENNLKADGDGKYDVRLDFSSGAQLRKTFGQGDSIAYLLTYGGSEQITEQSFNFFSAPAGGKGPFLVAAHVQNTTDGGSAWLAADTLSATPIPEPHTLGLLVLAAAAGFARRKAG
jgi:hypothetical protein